MDTVGYILRGLLGLAFLLGCAYALSVNRSAIRLRPVVWGIGLQLVFALLILATPLRDWFFEPVNNAFIRLLSFSEDGARFVFGNLVRNNVPVGAGALDNAPIEETPNLVASAGAFFAFGVLPTIIFFSALMALLYHIGLMPFVVNRIAWVMRRTMGTSGAESLSAASNIFVGQTEAPFTIRPFLAKMTNSELCAVMVAGFATVAGGVMAAYVGFLKTHIPSVAGHLLAASIMSAPAALAISKIVVPESGEPETSGAAKIRYDRPDVNVVDAVTRGARDGLFLALNVGAMLIAFIALVALLNFLLTWGGTLVAERIFHTSLAQPITLQYLLGLVFRLVAWLIGVSWDDSGLVGQLLGTKMVINEFLAYLGLSGMGAQHTLDPRSLVITSYALCGFSNLGSIGIQIGGIAVICPERRHDLARLAPRAMLAGTIASYMTATIAGMLIGAGS